MKDGEREEAEDSSLKKQAERRGRQAEYHPAHR